MQIKSKYWFTLVEVLVASIILSVVVFGILRLVNNDTKQTTNIEKNNEMYDVYSNSLECIKSFWYNYLSTLTNTSSLNFWTNSNLCLTWSYNPNLSFSWIEIKSYFDWNKVWSNYYRSYFYTSTWTNFVNIYTSISDWVSTKNFSYKLWK